jgi:mono/diheme cytochrome c family protein
MRHITAFLFAMAASVSLFPADASSRPQYYKSFKRTYVKIPAAIVNCAVCHGAQNKKVLTHYGQDLADSLGVKNQKAAGEILKALRKTEGKPTPRGGTWGDFLNNGLLPPA